MKRGEYMALKFDFSFRKWLLEKLGGVQERAPADWYDAETEAMIGEIYVRELAFWTCVNLISNAVSKCEFKTFSGGVEVKTREHYLWNVEPNKNQSNNAFLNKLISKLFSQNEALVVEANGQLLVADGFVRKPYALLEDIFSQVQVGDFSFHRTFKQSEVLYFTLYERSMRALTCGIYEAYRNLISYGIKSYQKSRGSRGILNISSMSSGAEDFDKKFEDLMNNKFKKFFNAENAVLPLFNGYEYTDIGSKTYSNEGTRDIRAMIDDVCDFTAKAFQIPPALVSGDVAGTDAAMDQILTFCIDPLTDLIAEEINRKRYGYQEFSKGNYIQIDTKAVKHVDLLSVAQSVDKLIASGVFTINDILDVVGNPRINEEWADQHFMTKNYETVAELLKPIDNRQSEGGETE